jgi:hypothetical protein
MRAQRDARRQQDQPEQRRHPGIAAGARQLAGRRGRGGDGRGLRRRGGRRLRLRRLGGWGLRRGRRGLRLGLLVAERVLVLLVAGTLRGRRSGYQRKHGRGHGNGSAPSRHGARG